MEQSDLVFLLQVWILGVRGSCQKVRFRGGPGPLPDLVLEKDIKRLDIGENGQNRHGALSVERLTMNTNTAGFQR